MAERSCLAIVLAAGEGTRMRSAIPKAVHRVGGLPMVGHALKAAAAVGAEQIAVVVGPATEALRAFVAAAAPNATVHEQKDRLGTADAVRAAKAAFARPADDVIVLYADTPLVEPTTLRRVRDALAAGSDLVVLGFRPESPAGYGRLVMNGDR